MKMNQEVLRAFCDTENFSRFQERLNSATEADALDILSYLLAEGMQRPAGPGAGASPVAGPTKVAA